MIICSKVKALILSAVLMAAASASAYAQLDTLKVKQVDTTVCVSTPKTPCDTVVVKQVDTTVCVRSSDEIRDSLRTVSPAIGINLVWAGIATPNISFEMPLGQHFSVGLSAAFKPGVNPKTHAILWPRWSPFDHDMYNETKWPHLAVLPYLRWWPKETFRGFFLGADFIYAHYNVGGINLPLGLYPDISNHRLEGDFYGAGLSLGGSIWITRHLNLVLSAGVLGGYKNATKYECPWCGAEVGTAKGLEVVPKLDVSIAYHLFDQKREEKKQNKR